MGGFSNRHDEGNVKHYDKISICRKKMDEIFRIENVVFRINIKTALHSYEFYIRFAAYPLKFPYRRKFSSTMIPLYVMSLSTYF